MPWGPNWQNHSWRSWIQKKTILKYPFFGAIVNGQFWGLIYEKMPCLTYWNKNVWSLGSKNAFEHKFWLKNSALRACSLSSEAWDYQSGTSWIVIGYWERAWQFWYNILPKKSCVMCDILILKLLPMAIELIKTQNYHIFSMFWSLINACAIWGTF